MSKLIKTLSQKKDNQYETIKTTKLYKNKDTNIKEVEKVWNFQNLSLKDIVLKQQIEQYNQVNDKYRTNIQHKINNSSLTLTQPYCQYGNLEELIVSKQKNDVQIYLNLAQGLSTFHEIGRAHGNLKPQNILMMKNKIDFKINDASLPYILYLSRKTNKPKKKIDSYYLPLQIQNEPWHISKAGDIWSLGIIFIELIIHQRIYKYLKKPPQQFQNFPTPELLKKISNEQELKILILAMLQKDEQRRVTIDDVIKILKEIVDKKFNKKQYENELKKKWLKLEFPLFQNHQQNRKQQQNKNISKIKYFKISQNNKVTQILMSYNKTNKTIEVIIQMNESINISQFQFRKQNWKGPEKYKNKSMKQIYKIIKSQHKLIKLHCDGTLIIFVEEQTENQKSVDYNQKSEVTKNTNIEHIERKLKKQQKQTTKLNQNLAVQNNKNQILANNKLASNETKINQSIQKSKHQCRKIQQNKQYQSKQDDNKQTIFKKEHIVKELPKFIENQIKLPYYARIQSSKVPIHQAKQLNCPTININDLKKQINNLSKDNQNLDNIKESLWIIQIQKRDLIKISQLCENIAEIFINNKNIQKALKAYLLAWRGYRSSGNRQCEANLLLKIGSIYYQTKDYNKSKKYLSQGYLMGLKYKLSQAIVIQSYQSLTGVYYETKQIQHEQYYYQQAIQLYQKNSNTQKGYFKCLTNIADLYLRKKQFKKAIPVLQKIIELHEEMENNNQHGEIKDKNIYRCNLAVSYFQQKQIKKAIQQMTSIYQKNGCKSSFEKDIWKMFIDQLQQITTIQIQTKQSLKKLSQNLSSSIKKKQIQKYLQK